MGADATLVTAAYRMGMANVPGDYSASFNKQYEGIIAASYAKSQLFASMAKGVSDITEGIYKGKAKRDETRKTTFDQ